MKKSKHSLQAWQIARVNLRHNFIPLLLLSLIVLLLTPVLFGITNLDSSAAATPLEMMVSIVGIILLVPIFQPEQDPAIRDTVSTKYIACAYVYLIRTVYSTIGIIVLVSAFAMLMLLCGCEITASLVFGTIADAMLLGATGLLSSALTGNLPASLMMSLLYYVISITMKSKLGVLNLFAMMSGDYTPNPWLFIISIIFIAAAILIKRKSS